MPPRAHFFVPVGRAFIDFLRAIGYYLYIRRRAQRREERGPFPFSGMAGEAACLTQGEAGAKNL